MTYRLSPLDVSDTDPFREDTLDRRTSVDFLANLLQQVNAPFVLALEAPYGDGKTTMVNMLRKHLQSLGYSSVYYNAWESDYAIDPLVPIVASLEDLLGESSDSSKMNLDKLKKLTAHIAKRAGYIAVNVGSLGRIDAENESEAYRAVMTPAEVGDIVGTFLDSKTQIKEFRKTLANLVETLPSPSDGKNLFFFIDELDRCRPTFAIETLERIKHLFDAKNVIFVLSVDMAQLEAITKSVYGSTLDAQEYLRRFIDIEFRLPRQDRKCFADVLVSKFSLDEYFARTRSDRREREAFVEIFCKLSSIMSLTLRQMEGAMLRLKVLLAQLNKDQFADPILTAFLIAIRILSPDIFSKIASGNTAPVGALEELKALLGMDHFIDSTSGVLLEGRLIAIDPILPRREMRISELKSLVSGLESNQEVAQRQRNGRLLKVVEECVNGWESLPPLTFFVSKIDLAVNIVN